MSKRAPTQMETQGHQSGDRIGDRYQILRLLGRGGSGTTYAARDLQTQQLVAIKVMGLHQLTDWKPLELLEREAKVLAQLDHPAIPNYLDYFHLDTPTTRYFYLVQELVEGQSLQDWVNQGARVQEAEVKRIAQSVLEILQYLHTLSPPVIHRDIKPSNILRRRDGRIYLADFGAVQDIHRSTFTQGGTFVGTLGYMPPEQMHGQAAAVSDLYALGTTLLFLLTGRPPAELPQVRLKVAFRDRVTVSPALANWLDRMIEPDPQARFASAQDALIALQHGTFGPPTTTTAFLPRERLFSSSATRRPKGTRIRLLRDGTRLKILIPPKGMFYSLNQMTDDHMEYGLAALLGGRIEMNAQQFKIADHASRRKGKTGSIHWVRLVTTKGSHDREYTHCGIRAGGKTYHFGVTLTLPEKMWLVAEIADFVAHLQGKKQLE